MVFFHSSESSKPFSPLFKHGTTSAVAARACVVAADIGIFFRIGAMITDSPSFDNLANWCVLTFSMPEIASLSSPCARCTAQIHKNIRHVIDAQKIRHVIDAAFSKNAFWAYILAKNRAYI
jgi:hypothetical protein